MTPLALIYWLRVTLGIIAAAISAIVASLLDPGSINTLLNCISVALLIYLISYYVLKAKFKNVVEKQSKIMTMGIGMYFFTWIAFFVLFYTIIRVATTGSL
jgi:hypothetical protein